jgi:hypothetical protein
MMLGFDAIAALPIADDAIDEQVAVAYGLSVRSGGSRRLSATDRGGKLSDAHSTGYQLAKAQD